MRVCLPRAASAHLQVSAPETAIACREGRIDGDRFLERLDRLFEARHVYAIEEISAAQIAVVCRGVPGSLLHDRLIVRETELDAELFHHGACDLLLDREDVADFPVVRFRPVVISVVDRDELRRDA